MLQSAGKRIMWMLLDTAFLGSHLTTGLRASFINSERE